MRRHLWLLTMTLPSMAAAYEPDQALRDTLSKTEKRVLVEATPAAQRLSVRLSFSPRGAFRDYERIAKEAGFEPYADCSVATFASGTNWRLALGRDATPAQITGLIEQCQDAEETTLGAKPVSQTTGDRAILRGIWQRNLEFVANSLGDDALQAFLQEDAAAYFRKHYGDPTQWTLSDQGFQERAVAEAAAEAVAEAVTAKAATAASEPGSAPDSAPAATPKTSAGANAQFERIALRTVTRYGLGGVYVENETYLLLKDGSILRNFSDNPYTLNVAASKRAVPKNWGRWRPQGNRLQVTWPGKKPTLWKTWFSTRAAGPGQTIEGRFQSADGFGGGRVANFNTVAFSADGRFAWASLKGGSTGGWLPAYSDKRRSGRYTLNGHSIQLRYNDGTMEDYAFAFYPKDDEHFVIGANHFAPLK